MLLDLPLDVWEMIFDLLHADDLQLVSEVESPTLPRDTPMLTLDIFRFLYSVIFSQLRKERCTGSRFIRPDLLTCHCRDLAH